MDEQKRQLQQLNLPREFWIALLTMRNHTIVYCKADYWDDLIKGRWVEGSLWQAINIVGDHLTVAIGDGWLDDID